jgi:hypothetical protein
MTKTMMIMMIKVKTMATDGEATVCVTKFKNQIQYLPLMWKGNDALIRKPAEYRLTHGTANATMAFQPPPTSLQFSPHTAISLPYKKVKQYHCRP